MASFIFMTKVLLKYKINKTFYKHDFLVIQTNFQKQFFTLFLGEIHNSDNWKVGKSTH